MSTVLARRDAGTGSRRMSRKEVDTAVLRGRRRPVHSDGRTNSGALRWAALAATAAVAGAGVLGYLTSSAHALHDPVHALQQLDAFYLAELAPGLPELGVEPGRPAVVFFCGDPCDAPPVTGAQLARSSSRQLARQYALVTDQGRVGPGYALVDSAGLLRYRTFDPGLHQQEIQVLVDALS